MLTPDTEAPAEMHWYIEELKALTAAENCVHTLHNTYPIRGAQVRDPQAWSMYLNETIERWGSEAEVMYGMHHWPSWGRERIVEMLSKGRDAYRYINDQTLRLANHGYTPIEIAEQVRLPDSLERHWAVRDYYGTISHNVKATYTRYLGWFDGNPANLDPLHSGRGGEEVRRVHGRRRGGHRAGPRMLRARRVPLGGPGDEARRLRRPLRPGSPRADRRRDGAARLPGRILDLAQRLPDRSPGAEVRLTGACRRWSTPPARRRSMR